ncbi:MAG: serine acetyltransferase [Kiritimatiellae bacterium]|nr:serine acetyltransferase [Kiritimatiellia bacterium]
MDVKELAKAFLPCAECALANTDKMVQLPGAARVAATLEHLLALMYPGCHGTNPVPHERCHQHIERLFLQIADEIGEEIRQVLLYRCTEAERAGKGQGDCGACGDCASAAKAIAEQFMAELPKIRAVLQEDIAAAYEGDPAAMSKMEIVMAYPGLHAITVHRLAHALYKLKVPILPRVMSELAHSRTGIDIHPGATIGEHFFIDHGTGVVVGETTVIGRNVKLYQGVTLGALSFPKDEETGMLMKGHKRHPNVEDNVVIYAGATILGGDTTIGHDSEIGGNVWLMDSIPPYSRVYNQTPFPRIKTKVTVETRA